LRCCPSAKDFLVEWEDVAHILVEYAASRSNPMVELMISELKLIESPSLGTVEIYTFSSQYLVFSYYLLHL
jgi:hypothetical protein